MKASKTMEIKRCKDSFELKQETDSFRVPYQRLIPKGSLCDELVEDVMNSTTPLEALTKFFNREDK